MPIRRLTRHRRVLVMGLGRFGGGVGAARFWAELGAHVTVTDAASPESLADSRAALAGLPIRFVLGEHHPDDFKNVDLVMVNPAVPFDHPLLRVAQDAGAELLTEIGLVWRLARGPVAAVTGSNGKSTTTTLLGAMMRRHDSHVLVGGNLGGSLLPHLPTHVPSAPLVFELSSFQLHYLAGRPPDPAVAVVTQLAPNHLDWHKTRLHYYESKRHLIRHPAPGAVVVLNARDELLRQWGRETNARVVWTAPALPDDLAATPEAAFIRPGAEDASSESGGGGRFVLRAGGVERDMGPVSALRIPGAHNRENALQAMAAASAMGVPDDAIRAALADFRGLAHRLEPVGPSEGGLRFINDSKATTPEAAALALACFDGAPVVAMVGGYDKGVDLTPLTRALHTFADDAVLMGATAETLAAGLARGHEGGARRRPQPLAWTRGPFDGLEEEGGEFAGAFREAVRRARARSEEAGQPAVVLLSPGCASWGMFTHFEERGDCFRRLAEATDAASR